MPRPLNDDRALAEAETRRRMKAGKQVQFFERYVDSILRDPKMMEELRRARTKRSLVGAHTSPYVPPLTCHHDGPQAHLRGLDDQPDVLRCLACGHEKELNP